MRIIIIIAYFGKKIDTYHLKKTIIQNPEVDFLICSDHENPELSELKNIITIKRSFSWFLSKLKYSPNPRLLPYKTCDFQPYFHNIFREYIENYDYWGHIDHDTIFLQKIHRFIVDNYDYQEIVKIGLKGHFTLYNTKKFDAIIRDIEDLDGWNTYKNAAKQTINLGHDENAGINNIFRKHGYVLHEVPHVDILPLSSHKAFVERKNSKYVKNSGLSNIGDNILYAHFQKQPLKNFIYTNGSIVTVNNQKILKYTYARELLYKFNLFRNSFDYKLERLKHHMVKNEKSSFK